VSPRIRDVYVSPDHAAVLRQVQAAQLPAQAVVDETLGEFDEEVPQHGGLGLLDVEAVVEQTVENGLAAIGFTLGSDRGGDAERP
jgi:hypothetical protein